MLNIGNKTFMNLQETVGWLLENNALPFQSTANYVANTEIAMSTLVNPSPAKVRVGSLIFFADSKVSTVIGVTSNSFIVSDQYNSLVDDLAYVSNVALNASGHLIVTLSTGETIDAGLVKQVTALSINGNQHLIANYNDGSSTDLGAIFSGNINISGNITATGSISAPAITGDSIIENMSGYTFTKSAATPNLSTTFVYCSVSKTGNKVTFVAFIVFNKNSSFTGTYASLGYFQIPQTVADLIYPFSLGGSDNVVDIKDISFWSSKTAHVECPIVFSKTGTRNFFLEAQGLNNLTANTDYVMRYECTMLLSSNLAS